MARTLSSTFESARRLLQSNKGWLLLLRLPLLSGGEVRLTSNPRHVTAGGLGYQACALSIDAPAEELQTSLGRLSITLPNVSRVPISLVESGEVLGQVLSWGICHEDAIAAGLLPGLTWRNTVLAATCDEGVARFECGHPSTLIGVPGRIYDAATFPSLVAGAIG